MNQPRRRKDPVLEAFVVIAVGRVSIEHATVDGAHQRGPLRRLIDFVIERVSSDRKASSRNEGMILAVCVSLAGLWFEVIKQQAGLPDQFVPILCTFLL